MVAKMGKFAGATFFNESELFQYRACRVGDNVFLNETAPS